MVINEYLKYFTGNLNKDYQDAISGLSDAQLYFLPNDNCNHIAFHAWHFIRTEDNIINFVCQNRKPPVWLRQGLPEKWGLPKVDQGTGMDHAAANAIRLPGIDPLIQYMHDVWADVEPYINDATEEELQSLALIRGSGEKAKLHHILKTVIIHGSRHLGQIYVLRSLQGLPGEA
jgi:hypothetical protein